MVPLENNPLAVLSFIAAPAVLTNASSVLVLGTSNRLARNIDRARSLLAELKNLPCEVTDSVTFCPRHVESAEYRAQLLVRAMAMFYTAVGCFAAASLTSLLGAILASTEHHRLLEPLLALALISGIGGLAALFCGCIILVRETRLALRSISEEVDYYRAEFASRSKAS